MASFRAPVFELPITIPARGSRDRVRALHAQLREAIVEGRLQAGLLMPPSRALAASLGLSRNSVITVYERLLGEGYLTSRQGAGTYVAKALQRTSQPTSPVPSPARDRRLNTHWRKSANSWTRHPFHTPARYYF